MTIMDEEEQRMASARRAILDSVLVVVNRSLRDKNGARYYSVVCNRPDLDIHVSINCPDAVILDRMRDAYIEGDIQKQLEAWRKGKDNG